MRAQGRKTGTDFSYGKAEDCDEVSGVRIRRHRHANLSLSGKGRGLPQSVREIPNGRRLSPHAKIAAQFEA
jgi:hypothetical protein